MNKPQNYLLQKSGAQVVADAPGLLLVQNHEWKKQKDNNIHPIPPHQKDECHNASHTSLLSFLL